MRTIRAEDAVWMNRYWEQNSQEDLERLGELARPDPQANLEFLQEFCASPLDPKTATEDIRVWCLDGTAVGYSTLKNIVFGETAQIHLHSLLGPHRRLGYGSILFCLSALSFIDAFQLPNLYCQPKRENPMPNGMLRKVGFPELDPIEYRRQDGFVIVQSRFRVEPLIAQQHVSPGVDN